MRTKSARAEPADPVLLNSRAVLLLDQDRLEEAAAVLREALRIRPTYVDARYNLGRVHRAAGELGLARNCFRTVLSVDPNFRSAVLALGEICFDLGDSEGALPYLEHALRANPDDARALRYCGQALADLGHTDLAIEFLRRAVETAPADLGHTYAAIGVLQKIEFKAEHAWYEKFLIACLDNPLVDHAAVSNAAASLLWAKPALRAAVAAEHMTASHLAALAGEPLLPRLLSRTVVRSWAFEEFITRLRRALVRARDPEHSVLLAGVAEQAFNTGYIQAQSPSEAAIEAELLGRDASSLTALELLTLAAYRPLIDVPGSTALVDRSDFPDSIRSVVRRTLEEPLREREIEAEVVALTPIRNRVSRQVQAQYDEYPYPRWIDIPSADGRETRLVDELKRHATRFTDPGWPARPRVLVPGCGTGYHPLSLARRHPEADVLALDLSRKSLAYAIRKQEELGIPNVQFRQADLLQLNDLGERFEYIDCAGVLHHLESPLDGWRVLAKILQPGGVMRVGLYSELARKTIAAAREEVAASRVPSTPGAIRAFRQRIMTDPKLEPLRSLAATTGDFFSMGEIRDLIFHVQEHRFDLVTIKRHLAALGLEFSGFLLTNRDVVRTFHALYPSTAEWLDLDCWAEFEVRYPDTFYGMYQFYCVKPA